MFKQIIQHLLENQGFVSSLSLSNLFRQPVNTIEQELKQLDKAHPDLLAIKEIQDGDTHLIYVKIARYGDELAKSLL